MIIVWLLIGVMPLMPTLPAIEYSDFRLTGAGLAVAEIYSSIMIFISNMAYAFQGNILSRKGMISVNLTMLIDKYADIYYSVFIDKKRFQI